jgi:putative transposase
MARQLRFVLPGVPVHIVQRGNARMRCFREERDYLVFLAMLGDQVRAAECLLHAYCLMGNHVHLLLTPQATGSCASLMKTLSHRYGQYFNRKYLRTGTLWEGRYRSCIVEDAAYVLACHRYIDLNPVRAGIVPGPVDYPWSSFAGNVGLRSDPLLTRHDVLESMASGDYLALTQQRLDDDLLTSLRTSLRGGYPLVGEALRERLGKLTSRKLQRDKPGPKRQFGV